MDTHRSKSRPPKRSSRAVKPAAVKAVADSSERVDLRIAPDDKLIIERAASMQGETISGFMKSVAMREARAVIESAAVTLLSVRDQQQFVDFVLAGAEPTPALAAAAARHTRHIASQ